jgi:protein gp37
MSMKTKIQWCDSTVNPTMGCDGCELCNGGRKTCYAGMLHLRYGKNNPGFASTFEDVTQYPGRMEKAARWSDLTDTDRPDKPWMNGLPRLIFVSDMSDSLSKSVPFEFLHDEIIANVTSEHGRRHRWLWLTKRPERMAKFSAWIEERDVAWPDNLWAGTSITSQATTSRIKSLLKVGDNSTIRFLSVEPQVESIALSKWLPKLDWIIQGGESGGKARPFEIRWATDLIGECKKHDVPYFLKQLGAVVHRDGERVVFKDSHANEWKEWTRKLRVREFPAQAT